MSYARDILVLVFIPTFEETISVRLFGSTEDGYCLYMNKPADKNYEQFRYGTTEEAEEWKVEIPKEEVEKIYSILSASKIAIAPTSGFFGVDGSDSFKLIFNNGFNQVSYYWKGKAPAGWEALEEIVAVIRPYVRIDGEYGCWK